MPKRPPVRPHRASDTRPASERGSGTPVARTSQPAANTGRSRQVGRSVAPGYWLFGQHAVDAALANPSRKIHEILVTREALAGLQARGGALRATPSIVERVRIDSVCERDAVHQGIAMRVEALDPPSIEEILTREGPVLVLDQVTDPRNIGAILRSAAAFGAAALLLQDRNAPQESGVMAKAASGALDTVPVLREVNLARALARLQNAGFWVVGLDAGGGRLDGAHYADRRVALVLGAEGAGLRRLTRESCDEIARVHMPGDMESLNVSNAAAVALYELVRSA